MSIYGLLPKYFSTNNSLISSFFDTNQTDFTCNFINFNFSGNNYMDSSLGINFNNSFANFLGFDPKSLDSENYMDCRGIYNYSRYTFPLFNTYLNTPPSKRPVHKYNVDFHTDTNLAALKNVYNPVISKELAHIAYQTAMNTNTVGWCAKGVMDSLQKTGIDQNGQTRVAAACLAVKKFEEHKDSFQRIDIKNKDDLKKLPAGCIIVWNSSEGHPYGHIAVTLGLIPDPKNPGKKYIGEASDHVQSLIIRNAEFAVFVPIDKQKTSKK